MRRIGLREVVLCCAAITLASTACVSRGVATSQRSLDSLQKAVESGPTPAPGFGPAANKDSDALDYHLHASGRVECGGILFKKQTAFVHAWMTHPGPDGERVDVPSLNIKFSYLDGLFEGAEVSAGGTSVETATAYETIRGVGDICSCVYAVSNAMLINTTRLQVREKICPE